MIRQQFKAVQNGHTNWSCSILLNEAPNTCCLRTVSLHVYNQRAFSAIMILDISIGMGGWGEGGEGGGDGGKNLMKENANYVVHVCTL